DFMVTNVEDTLRVSADGSLQNYLTTTLSTCMVNHGEVVVRPLSRRLSRNIEKILILVTD
ncbi:unnamed protein product, partial [Ilex paraguariensis]